MVALTVAIVVVIQVVQVMLLVIKVVQAVVGVKVQMSAGMIDFLGARPQNASAGARSVNNLHVWQGTKR